MHLQGLRDRDPHEGVSESSFVAQFEEAACTGCGTCRSRCPFGAFSRVEGAPKVRFTPERCFGCGLCVTTCPQGALSLVLR
ncbi:MAG: 4Fe-4S binding protein [Candidatus Bipolaricaulota bacterium]